MNIVSIIIDILLINLAELLAFVTRFGLPVPSEELSHYLNLWFIITVIRIWALYSYNLYANRMRGFISISSNVIKSMVLSSILIIAATFLNRTFSYPRLVIFIAFVYGIILLLLKYYILWKFFIIKKGRKRVMIIGVNKDGIRIAKESALFKEYNWKIFGFIDEGDTKKKKVFKDYTVLGNINELQKLVDKYKINLLVVAVPNENMEKRLKILSVVEETGVDYFVVPNFYEIVTGRAKLDEIEELPFLSLSKEAIPIISIILKRLFDITFSIIFLILGSPFFLLIAILIKLTSRGPVLYRQVRAGKNGKPFYIYKFRTMIHNADKIGPILTDKDDKRITKIGKFLRRYSLDELPQFYNVLIGDMSIVGPRPEVVEIVKKYKMWQRRVLSVKPGITGLAQISGRQELDIDSKLKIDLYYINNYSILLDVEIIFKTIIHIFKGDGAY